MPFDNGWSWNPFDYTSPYDPYRGVNTANVAWDHFVEAAYASYDYAVWAQMAAGEVAV